MIHEFTLVIDDDFADFDAVAIQFAAAFADGDVVPHTRHGKSFAAVYRETDKPLEATIRDAIVEVQALGYAVKSVHLDRVEGIGR